MKILLATRGPLGNIMPFLTIASELMKRGHEVTLNLPRLFENLAQSSGIKYVLQESEDMEHVIKEVNGKRNKIAYLLKWLHGSIDRQFEQLIPLLEKHDLLIACNTEISAGSIGEYCKKPVIRTAFSPLIPGKHISPPIVFYSVKERLLSPEIRWKLLNTITNWTVKSKINKNRHRLGLAAIQNFGLYEVEHCNNFLLYSRYLGSIDKEWKFNWQIGGYCFNDDLKYNKEDHKNILKFIRQDNRPTLFFTLGGCSDKKRNLLCEWLLHVCKKEQYKLIIETGWSGTGVHFQENDTLYLLSRHLPHRLFLPHCTAAVHHGGCGTTHNVLRAGIPQFIIPLQMDQYYWGEQVYEQGLGPKSKKITHLDQHKLHSIIVDLVNNENYKHNSRSIGKKVKGENGIYNFYQYIERVL